MGIPSQFIIQALAVAVLLVAGTANLSASPIVCGLLWPTASQKAAGAADPPVAGKKLTELEIYKLESSTKDFVIDLIAAGVWKKDDEEFKLFKMYSEKETVLIPKVDPKTQEYINDLRLAEKITGAEYRHALVTIKAFASYNKLDPEAKKRLNLEVFGQETRPEKDTKERDAGGEKIKALLMIIQGERATRTKENSRPPATLKMSNTTIDTMLKNAVAELDHSEKAGCD